MMGSGIRFLLLPYRELDGETRTCVLRTSTCVLLIREKWAQLDMAGAAAAATGTTTAATTVV